uniref:Uncharacterized protein n=1 Tax=Manihot esculenta TaxID=3983 RepID=A0A2C9V9J7_MANES
MPSPEPSPDPLLPNPAPQPPPSVHPFLPPRRSSSNLPILSLQISRFSPPRTPILPISPPGHH